MGRIRTSSPFLRNVNTMNTRRPLSVWPMARKRSSRCEWASSGSTANGRVKRSSIVATERPCFSHLARLPLSYSKPFACTVIIPHNVYSCIGKRQCVQLAPCLTRRCLPFLRFQRQLYKSQTGCPIGPPLGTAGGVRSSGPRHWEPSALEARRSMPAGQLARRTSPSYRDHRNSIYSSEQDVDGSQQIVESAVSDDDLVLLAEWGDLGIEVGQNIPAGGL